ncbi:cytochrome c3 family protein [Candidatus Methylocalor cossyra]|uniref:Cytochrome C n=1 Tax=Candidatus Methylocalor cossyra TaxID=3108543 RepID=A0ABM9NFM7_9GAMM
MSQIFRPRANALARIALGVLAALLVLPFVLGLGLERSPYLTGVGHVPEQPVPFSHQHHTSGLGIDCRYCHSSVERAAFAGLPATEVCMTCHSQLWTDAAMLAPVRDSWRTGRPLRWVRVNDLPDFVYFNHAVHLRHGVGCTTCHGPVGEMPLMRQSATLFMAWCLECHRQPERFLRPRERLFDPVWTPPEDQLAQGRALVRAYGVRPAGEITTCYTCHR